MPPRKVFFQIVGIICIVLAILGGFMYPLNTVDIVWVILYEVTIIFAVTGILILIYKKGFDEEASS